MTPPAVSQILEQLIRVMTMVLLAYWLLPYGLEYAAAGAAFGAVPGGVTGLIVLSFFYCKYKKHWQLQEDQLQPVVQKDSTLSIVKRLVLLALPVSCANIMVPISSSIDMLLVPNRLVASGFAVDEATTLFGYLAGMAQPLLMMATIPTMSLAASLVPAVSEAKILQDRSSIEQKASTAMKLCCLLTVPAAVGMSVLAEPISLLLYGTAKAATAIMHSGPAIWLLGMHQISTGVLQGIGIISVPMLNMLCGIVAKVAAVWFLTDAANNIAGAAWATNINFALATVLNIFVLRKYKVYFPWQIIAKIVCAALLMGIAVHYLHPLLLGVLPLKALASVSAIIIAAVLYAVLLFILGITNKKELWEMPLIRKFLK